MPQFSIIIPAYNEGKYLENTLKSIEQQNINDYEVLVIANGCADNTLEVAQKHKGIRLIGLQEAHVSKARNRGDREANGEVLIFLDADTSLNQNCLEIIQKTFANSYSIAT